MSIAEIQLPTDLEPITLPGDLPPRLFMGHKELRPMSFRTELDEKNFSRGWSSPQCERLLIAFAWHSIATHFVRDVQIADRLFSTLATAHAQLFSSPGIVGTLISDALSWYLPEALSHSTIAALKSGFPMSQNSFDERLRHRLMTTFVKWTSGFGSATSRPASSPIRIGSTRSQVSRVEAGIDARMAGMAKSGRRGSEQSAYTPRRTSREAGPPSPSRAPSRGVDGKRIPLKELIEAYGRETPEPPATARLAGGRTPRTSMHSTIHGGGMDSRPQSARQSMVVGGLPPVRREARDVSACSPLMARWLQIRQLDAEARGGATLKAPHRAGFFSPRGTSAEMQEEARAKGARTYRDVRREASRRSAQLVGEFEKKMGSTYNEFHVNKMQAKLIFIALSQERQHVLETQRESNEYANLLVAGRVLAEADEKERIDNLRGKAGTANGEAVKHGGMASLKFSLAWEPRLNMTSADVE